MNTQPQTNWEQIDTDVEMFQLDLPPPTPVTVTLPYCDMVLVEWALEDMRKAATNQMTALQDKNNANPEGTLNHDRTTLMRIYRNRAGAAKRIGHVVGAALSAVDNVGPYEEGK